MRSASCNAIAVQAEPPVAPPAILVTHCLIKRDITQHNTALEAITLGKVGCRRPAVAATTNSVFTKELASREVHAADGSTADVPKDTIVAVVRRQQLRPLDSFASCQEELENQPVRPFARH
jgi:hypothetical protein